MLILVPFLPPIIIMFFYTFIDQFIFARLNNYCWDQSYLGEVRFKSNTF
jgi:hypothetical protein